LEPGIAKSKNNTYENNSAVLPFYYLFLTSPLTLRIWRKRKPRSKENPNALKVPHSGTFGGQKNHIQSGFLSETFLKNSSVRLTAAAFGQLLYLKRGGEIIPSGLSVCIQWWPGSDRSGYNNWFFLDLRFVKGGFGKGRSHDGAAPYQFVEK